MTTVSSPHQIENLFIRMDKIGDLVLSLNSDQWEPLKSNSNHWWISQGTEFIAELAEPQRAWTSFSKNFSFSQWLKCVRWLKTHRPQRVFVFHAPWWVGAALFVAGVPYRVGRLSQWHSFLFFNYGIRQSRSRSDRHESQYNIDLLSLGLANITQQPELPARLPAPLTLRAPELGHEFLEKWGLKDHNYVVVHPGMAGSALNWSTASYAKFIRSLSTTTPIVVTGSKMDHSFVAPLKAELKELKNVIWLDELLSIKELVFVLKSSRAVVAPSTGVLHLAASLGVMSFGLYSPRRVQRPIRWGPRGEKVFVFKPPGVDPDKDVGPECMDQIHVPVVVETVLKQLRVSQ